MYVYIIYMYIRIYNCYNILDKSLPLAYNVTDKNILVIRDLSKPFN